MQNRASQFCSVGYFGPKCNVCRPGYYRHGKECWSCGTTAHAYSLFMPQIIVFGIGLFLYIIALTYGAKPCWKHFARASYTKARDWFYESDATVVALQRTVYWRTVLLQVFNTFYGKTGVRSGARARCTERPCTLLWRALDDGDILPNPWRFPDVIKGACALRGVSSRCP